MNARQAGNVLRRNAPQGEHPAYINNQEASWLKGMGGSGRPTKSGLRSYAYEGRTMSDDANFGKRAMSEKKWTTEGGIGDIDVRGYLDDTFGAVDTSKEHQRVANMGQRGFDAQGNQLKGLYKVEQTLLVK